MQPAAPRRYGVIRQNEPADDIDLACESLRQLGYAVVDASLDAATLAALSEAFERARQKAAAAHGGQAALAAIDEHNTIRLPLAYEPAFLALAANPRILRVCRELVADYVTLNQQNGIINPPNGQRYNQGSWHRDLPYQHFTSSRPLAINALFCLDAFTLDNGATKVLPASHREEAFPSDAFIARQAVQVTAPAGSFIVLDCMMFHTGGVNTTATERRAVNHVYTIPLLRQQIELRDALGDDFTADPQLRKLLGFDVRTPRSVADYLAGRKPA
jgi:ectoine hydroxylase-related dioxygenase (phytanoyl-CoA dioxygenase family)